MKELALRSKSLERLEHEEDITITTDGTIWQTIGTKNHVHPENIELQYHVSLRSSYSYHNHPAKETYYSFSEDDVDFFFRYGVQYQGASDDVYEYVIERTPETIMPENPAEAFKRTLLQIAIENEGPGFDIDVLGYNMTMEKLAKGYRFYYFRRRKE